MRYYYAIEWHYGRATNQDGSRCGWYAAFDSAAARNDWVAARTTEYSTQAGYREAISGSDTELRRLLRQQGGKPGVYNCRVQWIDLEAIN